MMLLITMSQYKSAAGVSYLPIYQYFFFLQVPEGEIVSVGSAEDTRHYEVCRMCVEELAMYLKPISGGKGESVKRMIQVDHHSDVKNNAFECCIIV